VGGCPPSWLDESWRYESVAFIAEQIPVGRLLPAFAAEAGDALLLGGLEIKVPDSWGLTQQPRRRPAFELHDPERIALPSVDYTVAPRDSAQNTSTAGLHQFLVGPNSPTFTDLDSAYRAFFLGKFGSSTNGSVPSELVHLRLLDDRAWLGPIHITATGLTVEIRGKEARGTTLEYFSPERRERYVVEGPGQMEVALPGGLPESDTWLWLTHGTEWRDYRALTRPWGSEEQLAAAGVEKEKASRDEQAVIEAIVYGGEGPFVEFKGKLPEGGSKTERVFNTVAAFANGEGGTVVFGVDRDEATVVGLGDVDVNKERDRIGQLIRTRVLPTPDFEATVHQVDRKDILVLVVNEGSAPPYGVITDVGSRDKPQFYVRRGASTYPAHPADLNQVFQRVAAAIAQSRESRQWY
jgi:Putative DNA-binding domain